MPQLKRPRRAATRPGRGKRKPDKAASAVDYKALAQFRYQLRVFLAFSEVAAQRQGLTPQQHQALLGIKGFVRPGPAAISDVARFLLIRHHSAVELISRIEKLGLIRRASDPNDARRVHLRLTAKGEQKLQSISKMNLGELRRAASQAMTRLLKWSDDLSRRERRAEHPRASQHNARRRKSR
jgi:DNA-binding MarR family transcriptional regulator